MSALPRKSRLALACWLAASCGSALAQQHDHAAMQMQDMPGMDMSSMHADGTQDEKKLAATPATKQAADKRDAHAGHHGMGSSRDYSQSALSASKKAGASSTSKTKASISTPANADSAPPAPNPHAGHAMPAGMPMDMPMQMHSDNAMDHASHGAHAHAHAPAAPAPLPPPTAAERAAAFPDLGGMDMSLHMDDNPTIAVLRGDRLEHVESGSTVWDARFGVGGNFDKFWLRSEGEQPRGKQAQGDIQLQWTHATGPWWDRVVSLRSDFGPGPSRQWAGIGVMGLAPYKFELEAHLYVGEQGRLTARFEAEYELLLINRLILTPRVELNAYSKDDLANRIGAGLSDGEAGLRLRYEFTRQFAPYVGYAWRRSFGNTAALVRAQDEPTLEHGWVAGLRFWF